MNILVFILIYIYIGNPISIVGIEGSPFVFSHTLHYASLSSGSQVLDG